MKSRNHVPIDETRAPLKSNSIAPPTVVSPELLADIKHAASEYEDAIRTKLKFELALKSKERRFFASAFGMKSKKEGGVIMNMLFAGKEVKLREELQSDALKFLLAHHVPMTFKYEHAKIKGQLQPEIHIEHASKPNGHATSGAQNIGAKSNGQYNDEIQPDLASKSNDHTRAETQILIVNRDPIEIHRLILDFIETVRPYMAAMKPLLDAKDLWGEQLEALAQKLPIWPWIEKDVKGVAGLLLGRIIGMAVNRDFQTGRLRCIEDYANPGKLWKRFGLALVQYGDGSLEIQKRSVEYAELNAYSPTRRALMYIVGECLVKANSYYKKEVYDPYRARLEAERPNWATDKTKDGKMANPGRYDKCSKRYMEKRFLKDLWIEWHKAVGLSDRVKYGHVKTEIQIAAADK